MRDFHRLVANAIKVHRGWEGAVWDSREPNVTELLNIYPVAGATVTTNTGRTLELQPDFDYSMIAAQDRDKLFNGSFDVIFNRPGRLGFCRCQR